MNDQLSKFQALLRELFQFDCADLDFGIYRIMNHKRDVIERFIEQDLPQAVAEELDRGVLAEQARAVQELQQVVAQIREALGADAFDADGALAPDYHTRPIGQKYLALKAKVAGGGGRDALEAAIYNHLYTFFSRYYQDGDFISKRRYSKRERYAIPYNGEEVYLYWANHDQYYVKTAEHFTDYTFTAPNGVTVHFKLQSADVEQNNVKGEKRFFLPRTENVAWDEASSTLVIPFEYRPLTEQENIAYGQKNQQKAIITRALETIPKQLSAKTAAPALAALIAERRRTAEGEPVTYLEHHLRQYTRRNTSDFFIHKDLKGFLSRELHFYLKNEVLNLDEMEAAGENLAGGWFQMMRLIKAVGGRVIEFLHQIEEFQKMLWEKRKFVTETQYCVTVGNISEGFYPGIAGNEKQWEEWKALEMIPGNADVPSASAPRKKRDTSDPCNPNADVPSTAEYKGWHSRGYLPHYDARGLTQFVTFRLHDSVPAEVVEQWKEELGWREELSADSEKAVELRKRIEKYEDSGTGARYLRDERVARLVQDALKHFDGKRYRLIAWCIMPNHVHVLFEPLGHSLSDIVHSWKSFTAHKANEILGRSGPFWAQEYFDRFIRDEKHFVTQVEYILNNPVKANLVSTPEEWPWSGCALANDAFIADATGTGDAETAFVSDTPVGSSCEADRALVLDGGGRDVRAPSDRAPSGGDLIGPRVDFLKTHPTLVLDTKHFDRDFVDRLLGSFDDLDEVTDGLLVHSENWQALNLLLERYRESIGCTYIDPPYNTGNDGFLYRDQYRHSSWIAMFQNRLSMAGQLLACDGALFSSIDDHELDSLLKALDTVLPQRVGVVAVQTNPKGRGQDKYLATSHDYLVAAARSPDTRLHGIPKSGEQISEYSAGEDEGGPYRLLELRNTHRQFNRVTRPNLWYPLYVDRLTGAVSTHPGTGSIEVYPLWPDGFEGCWTWGRELSAASTHLLIGRHVGQRWVVYRKDHASKNGSVSTFTPKTIWSEPAVRTDYGQQVLDDVIGRGSFASPKPPALVSKAVRIGAGREALVLDYFAGSGTTGHAVINLNREDSGRRKFILVEMADYFDTVLLPRIKKVTFTPEWKDGKPKRAATAEEAERSPRIIKYIRLESYEDALNNIAFDDASGQQALQFEDYLLQYMLKWETRKSETLLNVEKLSKPFDYALHIHRDGETRVQKVDLPETFNYLIGLEVETRKVYAGNASVTNASVRNASVPDAQTGQDVRHPGNPGYLVYHGRVDDRSVVVIWRETEGWQLADYERDRDFVAKHDLIHGADEVFVNGDSLIPGARALEAVFKARMFAPVEA